MGTNLNNATASISVSEVVSPANLSVAALGSPRVVLNGGGSIDDLQIWFNGLGSGAWIFGDTPHPECVVPMVIPEVMLERCWVNDRYNG
jgi:hypothetical protein